MSQLLLVGNPAKRRKPRSAAQKAATRRMLAARRAKTRSNPAKHRRHTYRRAAAPKHHYRRRAAVRSNPVHHRRRRVRRNPISVGGVNVMGMLKAAGIGVAGAIAVDFAYGLVNSYLPPAIQTAADLTNGVNFGYYLAKGAAAVGIGLVAKNLVGASTAAKMIEGSLTVTLHHAAKHMLTNISTSIPLGSAARAAGPRLNTPMQPSGLGRYLPSSGMAGVGKYLASPASSANPMAMREMAQTWR